MTERFQCGDNAELVSYLYEECDPADQEAIATHVSLCVACAAELAALQSARVHLASWTPPEAELGFRVVGARDQESRTGASPGAVPLDEKPMAAPLAAPSSGSWCRGRLSTLCRRTVARRRAREHAWCIIERATIRYRGVGRGGDSGDRRSVCQHSVCEHCVCQHSIYQHSVYQHSVYQQYCDRRHVDARSRRVTCRIGGTRSSVRR
jgi:hypothetical protein